MKPLEETWTFHPSSQACEYLPRIVRAEGGAYCEVLYVVEDAERKREAAVGRLAAAAPELYRALEACVEFMSASDRPTSDTEHQARAAIRKARGE